MNLQVGGAYVFVYQGLKPPKNDLSVYECVQIYGFVSVLYPYRLLNFKFRNICLGEYCCLNTLEKPHTSTVPERAGEYRHVTCRMLTRSIYSPALHGIDMNDRFVHLGFCILTAIYHKYYRPCDYHSKFICKTRSLRYWYNAEHCASCSMVGHDGCGMYVWRMQGMHIPYPEISTGILNYIFGLIGGVILFEWNNAQEWKCYSRYLRKTPVKTS